MKKGVIGLLIIAVLGLGAYFIFNSSESEESPEPSSWQTYENVRFGFSVEYLGNWVLGEAPSNNDGREFTSPNGDITCRGYGFENVILNDQGEPQTLNEFVDWLVKNMGYDEIVERNSTTMDGKDALEIVSLTDGVTSRGVYVLGTGTGVGLVCSYSTNGTTEEQNENFTAMQQRFMINASLDGV